MEDFHGGGVIIGVGVEIGIQMGVEGRSFSELDVSNIVVAGIIGSVAPGFGSTLLRGNQARKSVSRSVKAIATLKNKSANTSNRAQILINKIDENAAKISDEVAEVGKTAAGATAGVVVNDIVKSGINKIEEEKKNEPPPPPVEKRD